MTASPPGGRTPVVGFVDTVGSRRDAVAGWVATSASTSRVRVVLVSDGMPLGDGELGSPRHDAARAGYANVGFAVRLDRTLGDHELLSGRTVVEAEVDGRRHRLPLSVGLVQSEMRRLAPPAAAPVDGALSHSPVPRTEDELSALRLPVGVVSGDRSVVVARDGHLTIFEGSNSFASLHRRGREEPQALEWEELATAWSLLVDARRARAEADSRTFIQVVVPEKTSAMPRVHDLLGGPSRLLDEVESRLRVEPAYLSALGTLQALHEPFLPLDSHTSPAGAHALACAMLARLGLDGVLSRDVGFAREVPYTGDLTPALFGSGVRGLRRDPVGSVGVRHDAVVRDEIRPAGTGRFVGSHVRWSNSLAPVRQRVLVFGNSCFGLSGDTPAKLSWWFAGAFAELHLVWEPAITWELVDEIAPDIVIAQTVERFLPRVPSS